MEEIITAYLQHMREPAFLSGIGSVVAVFILYQIAAFVMACWNRVLQFFRPTKPVTLPGAGPSPYRQFLTCLGALVVVSIVTLIVIGWLLWSLFSI
jgi:hypothetical protein